MSSEPSTPPPDRTAPPPRWGRVWKWVRRGVQVFAVAVLAAIAIAVGTYFYFDRDLPSVEALRNYQPPQVTKVTCADGKVCAEFYRERRTLVPIESLPAHVKNAFLAAEDADFYKHEGLDYLGMVRAGLKTLLGNPQGASTITQQAVKNILLSHERSLSRKIREWILTPRIETALTKDQILGLYVNAIYFGHNRYGIEEAALFYFGKHARDLDYGEAAMLAGTVQSPHRVNPVTNMVKMKRRQKYVLNQMALHGFLPEGVVAKELARDVPLAPRPPPQVGAFYAEEIRRLLLARYGEERVMASGLRVEIAMDPALQRLADEALRAGLEQFDRKLGYIGPVGTLEAERFEKLRPLIAQRIAESGKRTRDEVLVADLARLGELAQQEPANPDEAATEEGAEERPQEQEEGEAPPSPDEIAARSVTLRPLHEGVRLAGFVTRVDDAKRTATVELVGRAAEISFSTVGWARPRGIGKWTAPPKKMSEVMKPGDLVRVKVTRVTPAPTPLEATLDQVPEVQGALLVINPSNRHVVAMVGGYDFRLSAFNRATQAKRQPGSSFKPFLYAAALDSRRYTPLTLVNDAPEAIPDRWTGKVWKPQNYERGGFEGPMTLRMALTKSKNTVSVRLIEALTPQVAIDFARRAGIRSPMPDNLTLALGTGEVSVLEIANAYATLHSLGRFAEPVTLVKVTDKHGTVLEEHQAAFEETLPPAVAYLTTSLMQSVVEEGTATAVRQLNRPAAGKTGTASEYRDAWFGGYTADLVATSWVGFDDHRSMGSGGTGGGAALPIWLEFMQAAHEDLPARDFEVPPGVTTVRIDPMTGLLAGSSVPGRNEPFLEGTEPTAEAPPPGQVKPEDFFIEDARRRGL